MLTKLRKTPNASVDTALDDLHDWMKRESQAQAERHLGVPVRLNRAYGMDGRWEKQEAACGHWTPITTDDLAGMERV
jgi:hypothetical protein